MKIQVFSDLHGEGYHNFEWVWNRVTPQAPIAVVAGDIHSRAFEDQLNEISLKFDHVIAVYGNHEWYHRDISWRADKTMLAKNVHVLDNDVVEIDGVLFVGCTLWSDFDNESFHVMHSAKDMINDFRIVRSNNGGTRFTPQEALEFHRSSVQWIKHILQQNRDKKTVMVTHFMPSHKCVNEKWRRPSSEMLNSYFAANCDDLIEMSEADLWICGHTHDAFDFDMFGTRMVCNPIGYPRENPTFTDKVVEI